MSAEGTRENKEDSSLDKKENKTWKWIKEHKVQIGIGLTIIVMGTIYFISSNISNDDADDEQAEIPDKPSIKFPDDIRKTITSFPDVPPAHEPEETTCTPIKSNLNADNKISSDLNARKEKIVITDEERKLLDRLESGELDCTVGNEFYTSGGSTVTKIIKDGVPKKIKEGPGSKVFNNRENEYHPGKLTTLKTWSGEEEKLLFLRKYGFLMNDDEVNSYSAKFKGKL